MNGRPFTQMLSLETRPGLVLYIFITVYVYCVCLMVLILDGNSYIGKKSLLFDLCKALDKVECSKKSDLFSPKNLHFF